MDLSKPYQSSSVCRIFVEYLNKITPIWNRQRSVLCVAIYKNKEVITRFKSLMSCWVEKYLFFYVIVYNVFDPRTRQTYQDIDLLLN